MAWENADDQNSFSYRYRQRYGPWAPPVSSMSHWVYKTVYLYADAVSWIRETDSPDLVSHIRGQSRRAPCRADDVHVARFGAGSVSIVS